MNPIIFQEYRARIITALEQRGVVFFNQQTQQGQYILIDNFVNQPVSTELSGNVVIGGPSIPMVMIADARTAEIKYFALKALLDVPNT